MLCILCILLSNTLYAQSGHTALWNFNGQCIDFTDGTAKIKPLGSEYDNTIWYVDSQGKIRLIYNKKEKIIYDENFNEIKNVPQSVNILCFIPVPCNESCVFAVGSDGYFKIDLINKEVVTIVTQFPKKTAQFLLVHHTNCKDLWLLFYSEDVIMRYLITENGIECIGESPMIDIIITGDVIRRISLSKDCEHFVAYVDTRLTGLNSDDIITYYYGNFDRSTAEFTVTKKYKTDNVCECIACGIAPNNDRIIVAHQRVIKTDYGFNTDLVFELGEFAITNGIPDFSNYTTIPLPSTEIKFTLNRDDLCYGSDNRLYIDLSSSLYEIGLIEPDADGKNKYTTFIHFDKLQNLSLNYLPATWFSENYCGKYDPCGDPCTTNPPTAQFDNAHVCYGDQSPLSIELSGTPPFTIEYTIDEKSEKVENITENHFNLSASGNYRLTKVSTLQCPQGGKIGAQAEAVIEKPLKKLIIKQQQ